MTRQRPRSDRVKFELVNNQSAIDAARDQFIEALENHGYPAASTFAVRLAFEEALSNAFRHGHKGLPDETPVTVEYRIEPDTIEIILEDRGPGFVPGDVPDPTLEENLDRPSGRGIMLIRAYMSDVAFSPSGNRIRMVYHRPASG